MLERLRPVFTSIRYNGDWRAVAGWAEQSQGKADGTLTFAANCHQNCCRSQAAAVERLKPLHQDQDSPLLSVSSAVAAGANLETIANLDPCQIHFLASCGSKVAAVSAKPLCSEALTATTALLLTSIAFLG